MNSKARLALALVLLAALGFGAWWWWSTAHTQTRGEITLYGNVDLRQVDLPFNDSERIAQVLVQEGDKVTRGQVLARLDTARLAPQVAQAEAEAAAPAGAGEPAAPRQPSRRRSPRRAPISTQPWRRRRQRAQRSTTGCRRWPTIPRAGP